MKKTLKILLLPFILIIASIGIFVLYLGTIIKSIGYLLVFNIPQASKEINFKTIFKNVW